MAREMRAITISSSRHQISGSKLSRLLRSSLFCALSRPIISAAAFYTFGRALEHGAQNKWAAAWGGRNVRKRVK